MVRKVGANQMMEWKKIEGFHYSVSENGDVRNDETGRLIKPILTNSGYLQYPLWSNGVRYYRYGHRLVAEYFVDNPFLKPDVNHIDGNKTNNKRSNLEWVTKSENLIHSYRFLGRRYCPHNRDLATEARSQKVMCVETGKVYKSQNEAAREYGSNRRYLTDHLWGRKETYAGLHWVRIGWRKG